MCSSKDNGLMALRRQDDPVEELTKTDMMMKFTICSTLYQLPQLMRGLQDGTALWDHYIHGVHAEQFMHAVKTFPWAVEIQKKDRSDMMPVKTSDQATMQLCMHLVHGAMGTSHMCFLHKHMCAMQCYVLHPNVNATAR